MNLYESIKNKLNESVDNDFLKIIKQQIKDPEYFDDNEVIDKLHSDEDYTEYVEPIYSDKEFYNEITSGLDLWRVSSKMSQSDVDGYLKILNGLKDFASKYNNRQAIKAIDDIIKIKFSKFDTAGLADKENNERSSTFYALFNDGGDAMTYLYQGSIAGNQSKRWSYTTSSGETRQEFRKRIKDDYEPKDLKIYDDKNKFKAACKELRIKPSFVD